MYIFVLTVSTIVIVQIVISSQQRVFFNKHGFFFMQRLLLFVTCVKTASISYIFVKRKVFVLRNCPNKYYKSISWKNSTAVKIVIPLFVRLKCLTVSVV